ncbi:MAG TPA: carboxypeptidase-like regulatory domain-containing protein, partial [Cytophagales bacterium]|nr:carboxypeptidase-like regulatory domain-containing protein [Cytophagales bacterium]
MFILVGVGASNVGYSQTTDSTTVVPQEEVIKDAPAGTTTTTPTTTNERVITGQVLSKADNSPVVGAIVFIKGTNIATETDENGNYSITVPQENADGTLVIRYDDDTTTELPIATTTNFNVQREEDVTNLETVQIIGYGTQEKEDVTGAISSVKGTEIAKVVVSDPAQAIQGRVTGVNVSQNTGAPGSPLNIQVRGVGTIGNSRPL